MKYLFSFLFFAAGYLVYYLAVVVVLFLLLQHTSFHLSLIFLFPMALLAVFLFSLALFRAKRAADGHCGCAMTFLQAHRASGTDAKTYLSFLPLIGVFFEDKKTQD